MRSAIPICNTYQIQADNTVVLNDKKFSSIGIFYIVLYFIFVLNFKNIFENLFESITKIVLNLIKFKKYLIKIYVYTVFYCSNSH